MHSVCHTCGWSETPGRVVRTPRCRCGAMLTTEPDPDTALAVADTEPATRPAVCTQCGGSGRVTVVGLRLRCACPAGLR